MTMDFKVCSLRFHQDEVVDLFIKQVDLLNQVEISKVFQCDGLLLCIANDESKLVVWNPYLGQTKCIRAITNFLFHGLYRYALGYDINNNHKILRFADDYIEKEDLLFGFEIYHFSSDSWRVLDVTPDWDIYFYQRGVSLKGNTYFFAQDKIGSGTRYGRHGTRFLITEFEDFLLCFDFTKEGFGPRLPLPFHSKVGETVTLSCVREEQLAVLYQKWSDNIVEIWLTTKIEPNALSWSKFLKVDMRPLTGFQFKLQDGSFFIDQEEKIAVVFDLDRPTKTGVYHHTAFIIGDEGYFKSVCLGEARNFGKNPHIVYSPLVCSSSYLPSLVQIN